MTRLVLLGGFLGAGKTTTLLRFARGLAASGWRVGVLANDQGEDLVDDETFRASGLETGAVRGGCFCCRLSDFVEKAEELVSKIAPDVLLAEPVGSCTDLVATVLRPLKSLHPGRFEAGPYTVLVDPLRARELLDPSGHARLSEKVAYVYRLQQAEAAAIAVNKVDLLSPSERREVEILLRARFPAQRVLSFSARTGEGFGELARWLLSSSEGDLPRSPVIDYDRYAEGEAELAWMDARYGIRPASALDVGSALSLLGAEMGDALAAEGLAIAHVKLLLRSAGTVGSLGLSRDGAPPDAPRVEPAAASGTELAVNARVASEPARLRRVLEGCVERWLASIGASGLQLSASSFSPPRPRPEVRIAPEAAEI